MASSPDVRSPTISSYTLGSRLLSLQRLLPLLLTGLLYLGNPAVQRVSSARPSDDENTLIVSEGSNSSLIEAAAIGAGHDNADKSDASDKEDAKSRRLTTGSSEHAGADTEQNRNESHSQRVAGASGGRDSADTQTSDATTKNRLDGHRVAAAVAHNSGTKKNETLHRRSASHARKNNVKEKMDVHRRAVAVDSSGHHVAKTRKSDATKKERADDHRDSGGRSTADAHKSDAKKKEREDSQRLAVHSLGHNAAGGHKEDARHEAEILAKVGHKVRKVSSGNNKRQAHRQHSSASSTAKHSGTRMGPKPGDEDEEEEEDEDEGPGPGTRSPGGMAGRGAPGGTGAPSRQSEADELEEDEEPGPGSPGGTGRTGPGPPSSQLDPGSMMGPGGMAGRDGMSGMSSRASDTDGERDGERDALPTHDRSGGLEPDEEPRPSTPTGPPSRGAPTDFGSDLPSAPITHESEHITFAKTARTLPEIERAADQVRKTAEDISEKAGNVAKGLEGYDNSIKDLAEKMQSFEGKTNGLWPDLKTAFQENEKKRLCAFLKAKDNLAGAENVIQDC